MPGMDGFINFNGTLEGSIAGGGGGNVTDVKVRDSQETTFESVVNEQGVAEIDLISYVRRNELAQAIENVENSIDNIEQLVDSAIWNYSTSEVNTGQKWIDGKDIYCRVLDLGVIKKFEVGWNNLTIPHNNYYDNIIDSTLIYPNAYCQNVGVACNDPTYLELCAYYSTFGRFIKMFYTKNV